MRMPDSMHGSAAHARQEDPSNVRVFKFTCDDGELSQVDVTAKNWTKSISTYSKGAARIPPTHHAPDLAPRKTAAPAAHRSRVGRWRLAPLEAKRARRGHRTCPSQLAARERRCQGSLRAIGPAHDTRPCSE